MQNRSFHFLISVNNTCGGGFYHKRNTKRSWVKESSGIRTRQPMGKHQPLFTLEFRLRMNFEWVSFGGAQRNYQEGSLKDVFRYYVTNHDGFDGEVNGRNHSQFDPESIYPFNDWHLLEDLFIRKAFSYHTKYQLKFWFKINGKQPRKTSFWHK